MPLGRNEAWRLLTDVAAIASCLPGASLRGMDSHGCYHGELSVKLGPVRMTFDGKMRFTELDAERGVATVKAAARETRNRGSADADIRFQLEPQGAATRVAVVTDLTLAGQAAQYGRAAGVLQKVAGFMLGRFASCLAERISAAGSSTAPAQDIGQ